MTAEVLPRRFGSYLLTAFLGEDALGRVFRGMRMSGERVFARVRILEGPEISEDAVVDAIEENGEIHTFLKNPAIARGVQLDAVEGTPYIAWNEESGRTLDALLRKVRDQKHSIPYEHALLIAEKVATALDHAYNTTVDGERTLHGLVWPGFVSISDDGETRLTGFGLASGFLPSLGRPRFAREVAPYLAPEERASSRIGKNSDVYSVGAILFELLVGRLPSSTDPLGDLRTAQRDGAPIAPEAVAILRMCLGPAEGRFQSSGELRRELGKLLFSGPYSPSTFNLAFFLNSLFGMEIEVENRSRSAEASLDPATIGPGPSAAPGPARAGSPATPPRPPLPPPPSVSRDLTPAATMAPRPSTRPLIPSPAPPPIRRRGPPFVLGGALLVAAAVAGTAWVVLRRQQPAAPVRPPVVTPSPVPATPTLPPPPAATGPTTAMSDAQFKDEVARRVSTELKKMEQDMRRTAAAEAKARPPAGKPAAAAPAAAAASGAAGIAKAEPAAVPSPPAGARAEPPAPTAPPEAEPTSAPAPPPEAPSAAAAVPSAASEAPAGGGDPEIPPKILRIVRPVYPQSALRARIGGIVLLRVLVAENGVPVEIQVVKSVAGGLTESAVAAVRGWRFEPATRGGTPVRGWTTIPIPFQP